MAASPTPSSPPWQSSFRISIDHHVTSKRPADPAIRPPLSSLITPFPFQLVEERTPVFQRPNRRPETTPPQRWMCEEQVPELCLVRVRDFSQGFWHACVVSE